MMSSIYGNTPYQLEYVTSTEEILQVSALKGWRRFRIEYVDEDGHSNLEGQLYFPPGFDPFPLLDEVCDRFNNVVRRDND